MDEFPDPDEEFELQYGDEMDLLNDAPQEDDDIHYEPPPKLASRRSLNFKSPEASRCHASGSGKAHNEHSSDKTSSTNMDAVAGPSWLDISAVGILENEEARKRKVQDLFGDIDDIDFGDTMNKRKKTEEETDMELMSKILSTRQDIKQKAQAHRIVADSQPSQLGLGKKENISKRVPKWPFMPITTNNGERWYLRLHSDSSMECQISKIGKNIQNLGLLSTSYAGLRSQAEEILRQKIEREHEVAFERKLQALEELSIDSGCELNSEDEEALWVEKYKPRHYLDLLSDESMNRTLLQWLKLWDKVVFGRERKNKPKPKDDTFSSSKKGFQKKVFKKFEPKGALNEELDENDCPKNKVALLCGPPGLGKTTLAHLVAKHAGYNVVEMNASDDRSPDAFRLQLQAATQMRAVIGHQPRPNCLIIDEIDGAPAASIEVLLKFLSGKDISKKKVKKKGDTSVVRRPIICICNDIYVPALRSLRQVAFVLQFPPTTSSRLAQRLLEVCHKQDLRTDMGTLLALAEKTHNDIRSCMSVLQFFKGQGAQLKLADVQRSNVGQKDMHKGLFAVWNDIFQIQRPRRNFSSLVKPDEHKLVPLPNIDSSEAVQISEVSRASRMLHVLQTVQSFGDYERVAQGVFENYLNMNLKDSRLEGVFEGLDWFSHFNILTTKINTTQNYILMPYLPYAFVMWHFLFSSFNWPKIIYPKEGYEASQKQALCRELLWTLMRGMTPGVRAYTHAQPLLQDTLPLLPDLIVPSLRPVSSQLFSPSERTEMAHAVGVMLDYNITYTQQRNADGAYEFLLDPNIDDLALYPGGRPRRLLAYNCKQLMAHELDLERMRRAEARLGPASEKKTPASAASKPTSTTSKPSEDSAASTQHPLPNHLQKLTVRPVKPRGDTRVVRDFFGRPITCVPAAAAPGSVNKAVKVDEIVKSPIWFHFKEGYSNAVRRPVKMHELE